MKPQLLLVFIFVLLSKISFGDIIILNTHYVTKCVKITNLEEYPDVSFFGCSFYEDRELKVARLSSAECIDKVYKHCQFAVYAVSKSYLEGKDMGTVNLRQDPNALLSNIAIEPYKGYVWDSIPISGLEEYYKVVGFLDSQVILYKWKQVTKYNNGKPDLIENFTYDGKVSSLYQTITEGISSSPKQPGIEVYPNPARKNIHLRIYDSYKGTVSVELVTAAGKTMKSYNLSKPGTIFDYDIPVANVAKGVCFVRVQMGKTVENKKVLIK